MRQSQPLAFVYFDYKDDNQTPGRVLASILKQVISALPKIPPVVSQYYTGKRGREAHLSPYELEKLLISVLEPLPRTFIVIDALDECDERRHRRDMLNIIRSLRAYQNIRIFLTSRPYPSDIQSTFLNSPKINIEARDSDLRLYMVEQLVEATDVGTIDRNFMEDIIQKLINGSQGL
jgi:hypothetical protein